MTESFTTAVLRHLAASDCPGASQLLRHALDQCTDADQRRRLSHNLAVILAKDGQMDDALALLDDLSTGNSPLLAASLAQRWLRARLLLPAGAVGDSLAHHPPQKPVYGFMHVALKDRWSGVVQEQMDKALQSGLAGIAAGWFVSVVGPGASEWQPPMPAMQVVHRSDRFEDAEFPILRFLRAFCVGHDCYVFYTHTKGVFYPAGPVDDWRRYMEYFVIERHLDCVMQLADHDVAGVNWHTVPWPHFSGNFWWARSDYIRTLPPVDNLGAVANIDSNRRFLCERWIGENRDARIACLHESSLDHYHLPYPRSEYKSAAPPGQLRALSLGPRSRSDTAPPPRVDAATKPGITGFMHVATINHWRLVVQDQLMKMQASGLWDELDRLFISCVGPAAFDLPILDRRVTIVRHNSPLSEGERPTLALLKRECQRTDGAVFYIHTKGVGHPGPGQEEWRHCMEHFALLRYRECQVSLADHDICGINWQDAGWCRIFAGNFWWARADYIRSLPDIETLTEVPGLDGSRRHQCERWIGENPGVRVKCLFQAHTDHYANEPLPRERYARLHEVIVDESFKPSAWTGLENRFQDLLEPLAEVRAVVEIGVEWGFSLFCFARAAPHSVVIGIDPFESLAVEEARRLHSLGVRGVQGSPEACQWVQQQLPRFPNVLLLKTTSEAASAQLSGPIDIVHLDAIHTYDDVRRLFNDWEHKLRPGGCILLHDTLSFPNEVGRFFHELPGRKAHLLHGCGLGAWYKPLGPTRPSSR